MKTCMFSSIKHVFKYFLHLVPPHDIIVEKGPLETGDENMSVGMYRVSLIVKGQPNS